MTNKDDFASFMESSFSTESNRALRVLKKGDVVTGIVVQIGSECVFLDVGSRADGRIARTELQDENGDLKVKVGDRIEATVLDGRAAGGPLLAVTLGKEEIDISTLQIAMESNVPVEGKVARALKGGLEVELGAVRAFCPASQFEIGYVAQLEQFVDHIYRFKVIEIRDGGRSIVVSRRAILEQERAEKVRALEQQLQVGQDREGVVQSIQKYGAFVDLGGIQGLLHISELVHGRVERVEDIVRVGETIKVRILEIGKKDKGIKISLSMKALQQLEKKVQEKIGNDEVLKGKVSRLVSFGLFVETAKGEGLVPVQELPLAPGSDHRRSYPVGKEVDVVLLDHDASSGRLRFSISGVLNASERINYQEYEALKNEPNASNRILGSFGELLQKEFGKKAPVQKQKPRQQNETTSDATCGSAPTSATKIQRRSRSENR
jgi:small subunit ribosomal protein S1